MRSSLTLVLLLIPPAFAQQNDAEKLFRAMEKKIQEAKSLKVAFETEEKSSGLPSKSKGSLHLAEGNKTRWESRDGATVPLEVLMVSDGKQSSVTMSGAFKNAGLDKAGPAEPKLNERLATLLGRGGLVIAFALASDEGKNAGPFDPDKKLPVSDFKLGNKELFGTRESEVVEFKLTFEVKLNVKLWIDTKTMTPLKRQVVATIDSKEIIEIETYTEFALNPQLDPKLFELPK